ncbi:MAG TPA: hypothetical protein V6D13_06095 [Halomicronema sp.]
METTQNLKSEALTINNFITKEETPRRSQAQLLSNALDSFDTALEMEPQRIIQYQMQPASPHIQPVGFPGLPAAAHIQWCVLIGVHLAVLAAIKKRNKI